MQHTLRDLVPVKAFLLAGTTVTIVEEKVGGAGRQLPTSHCLECLQVPFPLLWLLSDCPSPIPLLDASWCLSRKVRGEVTPASPWSLEAVCCHLGSLMAFVATC
jgi:hypothetical protein